MGLRAIYRRPRTSRSARDHRVYPYLLENVKVAEPNQVWASDITYMPMARGFLYLVAWRLSNTLEADCCVKAFRTRWAGAGPRYSTPTVAACPPAGSSPKCSGTFRDHEERISMDGKGRYADKIFVERLWRTMKYEEV